MNKIRISAVSYLNTAPFVYGLKQSGIVNEAVLSLDYPSLVSERLINGDADLGLVPVATFPELKNAGIVSNYCIGASAAVASVKLLSTVPLDAIRNIHLDYQSRTSVMLTRVLARFHWQIAPQWKNTSHGFESIAPEGDAVVVIGDRVFSLAGKYPYEYDLAAEWIGFTGLPFVFACWIAVKKLDDDFVSRFNDALALGLANKNKVINEWTERMPAGFNILNYLENNIDYIFDAEKQKGMQLFLDYVAKINQENGPLNTNAEHPLFV